MGEGLLSLRMERTVNEFIKMCPDNGIIEEDYFD